MRTTLSKAGIMGFLLLLCASFAWSQPLSYQQQSAATQEVAERYHAAYIAKNWQAVDDLLAEQAFFTDPTAEPVFGPVHHQGKQAMMANFREGYAGITHMQFMADRKLFSGQFAVFEGALDWDLRLKNGSLVKTRAMPLLTVIKVVEGRVVEHIDYGDYQPFLTAYEAVKAN